MLMKRNWAAIVPVCRSSASNADCIEADIYRCARALKAEEHRAAREELTRLLHQAEARLADLKAECATA
jgi:hypothetical protein